MPVYKVKTGEIVVTENDENWEYRCNKCNQLRFYSGKKQPKLCHNCESTDITIGRPGSLPLKVE